MKPPRNLLVSISIIKSGSVGKVATSAKGPMRLYRILSRPINANNLFSSLLDWVMQVPAHMSKYNL